MKNIKVLNTGDSSVKFYHHCVTLDTIANSSVTVKSKKMTVQFLNFIVIQCYTLFLTL